ncbi:MAG: SIMPL domain-containing protein [Pseudomonadota bacterium]
MRQHSRPPAIPRPALGLCLALALLFLPTLALAAEPAVDEPGLITVSSHGRLELAPDQVSLALGVSNQAAGAKQAAADNAAAMAKVLAAVKAKLGPQDVLSTASYRVTPRREWDQAGRRWRNLGYEAENLVTVKSRQPAVAAEVLEAASQAGANRIDGPHWALAEPEAAQRRAAVLALTDARAQAEALAAAVGLQLGRLMSLTVHEAGGPTPVRMEAMRATADAAAMAPPLEPGQVTLQASVTAVYQLIQP